MNTHIYIDYKTNDGAYFLSELYSFLSFPRSIVFVGNKDTALQLETYMRNNGISVSSVTLEDKPDVRMNRIKDFDEGRTKILFTTLPKEVTNNRVPFIINYAEYDNLNIETYFKRTVNLENNGVVIHLVKDEEDKNTILGAARGFNIDIMEYNIFDLESLDSFIKKCLANE